MMDASIGCWDAKFAYWYVRPFQADPLITTPVGRPNFPAYPSAHSCLSASAAGVLAALFPAAADDLQRQVEEAGVARLYAGLHFHFDVDAGRQLGFAVARAALGGRPAATAHPARLTRPRAAPRPEPGCRAALHPRETSEMKHIERRSFLLTALAAGPTRRLRRRRPAGLRADGPQGARRHPGAGRPGPARQPAPRVRRAADRAKVHPGDSGGDLYVIEHSDEARG